MKQGCICGVLVLFFVFLPFLTVSSSAGASSIAWGPKKISVTMPPGTTSDVEVTFRSDTRLKSVTFRMTSGLSSFVTITPAKIGTVNANVSHQLNLHFIVEPEASPGTYTGTVQLAAGSKTYSQPLPISLTVTNVVNQPPVANAGPDQTVFTMQTVQLDGSGSTDVDGNFLTFAWTMLSKPEGSNAALSDPSIVNPTFVADEFGGYVVQLIVNDGLVDSAPDSVVISTGNSPPVANAGPDQTVFTTQTVQLDGSGSTDVDGNPLAFVWSIQNKPEGSNAALSDPSIIKPTFVADEFGDYAVQLIVNDGFLDSAPDTVAISTGNSPPVADAGPDQTVYIGDQVQLDGSASSDVDDDPLTFAWSFVALPAGSGASMSGPALADPTFTADKSGHYVVQLIVNDGSVNSSPDTVTVSTANSRPAAVAGPPQSVIAGSTVQLDGSGSSDADDDPLQYFWSIIVKPAGSEAALDNPSVVDPTFVADLAGTYVVQLIVIDGKLNSDPSTVEITATPVAEPDLTITITRWTSDCDYDYYDTITVTNSGAGPTSGTVTVTDTMSSGLGIIQGGYYGTGWSCDYDYHLCSYYFCTSPWSYTCTRSDELAAGQSYPPITLDALELYAALRPSMTHTATVSASGESNTANNTASETTPGDTDTDGDGYPDCWDACPNDPDKMLPGECGCGVPDTDIDDDGYPDCIDGCPTDPEKDTPGVCGCGISDTGDTDHDGIPDCHDGCPNDPTKNAPGVCGCGVLDTDTDHDDVPDCTDGCPTDPTQTAPGVCGCGVPDTDTDHDDVPDCTDGCPTDPNKVVPGACGCSYADVDTDSDGHADCIDGCLNNPLRHDFSYGSCYVDSRDCNYVKVSCSGEPPHCLPYCNDDPLHYPDPCLGCPPPVDLCPDDPDKVLPGTCGCGVPDTDTDGDSVLDCIEACPFDPNKTDPGLCGCGVTDVDSDGDGVTDCIDSCPADPDKIAPGVCGCGIPDTDTDGDGIPDCVEG